MKLVVIESPYAGDITKHVEYVKACMRNSLARGEAPYAPHLMFTREGLLRDDVENEREIGMSCGFAWAEKAALRAFYVDLGISSGMRRGLVEARRLGQPFEIRAIYREVTVDDRDELMFEAGQP